MRRFNDLYQALTKVAEIFYKVKSVIFIVFNICNILMYFTTYIKNKIMILTTTNTIDGHKIENYLGIVTGVSTSMKTTFSFKTEKNKKLYDDFINKAKEDAFQKLKANAVVGIKLDIEPSSSTYFFVSITGTAVKVKL